MNYRRRITLLTLIGALALGLLGGCAPDQSRSSTPEGTMGSKEEAGTAADGYSSPGMMCEPYTNEPYTYEPYDTEEYSPIDERGFIPTSIRPRSTFSADVDTASYCNLRRMVADGTDRKRLPPDAVRIEEMLNYFDYDYALPEEGDLFGVTNQIADCPWNPEAKLLIMGFSTEKADYATSRGSNLVFLIDTSGSMSSDDKLPLLQDAFGELVESLTEYDRVSIVTYSGSERVVLEDVAGSEKRTIMQAIDSLHAEGSTNGEAGLEKAYRLAERSYIEGGVNRIIMASDGDLNVGMSSERELHDFVADKRSTGVYLSVLGFGSGNYKDNKMETLADNGNGSYHYIDCLEEAGKVFGRDLCANLIPLADDVKVQVEFNPDTVTSYRLIGYENRALSDEDFRNNAVDAGEIGQGHQFTIAYEIVLGDSDGALTKYDREQGRYGYQPPEPMTGYSEEWLSCSIRYRSATTTAYHEQLSVITDADHTARPTDDWKFAASVIECGMVLRNSEYAGSASLREAQTLIEGADLEPERLGFSELLRKL